MPYVVSDARNCPMKVAIMSKTTLFAPCFLTVALATAAAHGQMLLLELGWENQPQSLPAVYAFSAANIGEGNSTSWREEVTAYPFTSMAPLETVERFNELIAAYNWPVLEPQYPLLDLVIREQLVGGAVLQGPERPALCTSCYWSRLVANEDDDFMTGDEWAAFAESVGWNVDLRVPLLGQGLRGYEITAIERIVTADAQTIRLYGNLVPEPAGWLLALCCALVHWRTRVSKPAPLAK
jgi:hypothetical protein